MKALKVLFLSVLAIALFSCGSDDDDIKTPDYPFDVTYKIKSLGAGSVTYATSNGFVTESFNLVWDKKVTITSGYATMSFSSSAQKLVDVEGYILYKDQVVAQSIGKVGSCSYPIISLP